MTPRGDRRGGEGLRPPRPRRRRIPDRAQVVVHAARTTASRTTWSATPTSRSRARSRTARSCAGRRTRSSRAAPSPRTPSARRRCYIYIRGEFTEPLEGDERGGRGGATPTARWATTRSGSGKRIEMMLHRGRGRLHLRRRDRDDELDRGQARQSADQAAVPGGGRPVRHADHDQQRRDPRRGAAHPEPRRRVVQGALPGQPEEHRHQAGLGLRPRAAARELRSHDGHSPMRGHPLRHVRRAAGRAGSSRRSSRAARRCRS